MLPDVSKNTKGASSIKCLVTSKKYFVNIIVDLGKVWVRNTALYP